MSPSNTHFTTLWMILLTLAAATLASCCPCNPTDEDCRTKRKKGCDLYGECTMRTHHTGDWYYTCYAATEEDCRQSKVCKEDGKCYPNERGKCVLKEDVDKDLCKDSWVCRHRGGCVPLDGVCIPTKAKHCKRSYQCKAEGRCGLVGMSCLATKDKHCRQSTGCEIAGLCKIDKKLGMNMGCSVAKDEDACQDSLVCQDYDRCHRRPYDGCDQSGKTGCGLYYCGPAEDEPGTTPCIKRTQKPEVREVCEPDGRCILNEDDQCIPLP